MRTVVVDWSGRVTNEESYIWLAEAVDGELIRLESGRSRHEMIDELSSTAANFRVKKESCLIGLDFSFSFPAWFVRQLNCTTADQLWGVVAELGEDWLRVCTPPFWGRPGKPKPTDTEQFRRTETETQAVHGIRPKSTFQIGGAGSVGTGSIRGMPLLRNLKSAGCSIWPFDPPSSVTICEVYPRLCTGPVIKSSVDARREYFHERGMPLHPQAVASEDAFDALISALMISKLPDRSFPQHVSTDGTVELEGMIFDPRGVP